MHHEKSLQLISLYNLPNKKVAEIIGGSTGNVNAKKKMVGYNKFTQKNFEALKKYAEEVCEKQKNI